MSPTRDKSGAPAYCFSYILIKEHNSYNILVFSLLISHISLLFISNLVKLIQLLSIMDISLCRSFFKLLQLKRKCISSSISPLEHLGHTLLCYGIPMYLPFSIANWCADNLNLVRLLLKLKFWTMLKYFSQPKLALNKVICHQSNYVNFVAIHV